MARRPPLASSGNLALLGVVALAAALRIPGLATDLWLDELWTLKMIEQRTDSIVDVFTSIRHSNNHYLNTLYFYLLGDQPHWSLYRLPSLVAGVASVWLAFRIGARAGRAEAVLASGLCATSYLLIHFSSEARGYAPAIAFALAAFDALQRHGESPRAARAAQFGLFACLGFLSHLMFLHAFVAAFAWQAVVQLRRGDAGTALRRMLALFAPATVFVAWLYVVDVRHAKIGDGPELDLPAVLVKALSYSLGGPPSGPGAVAVALAAVAAWALAIVWLARARRDEWIFHAVVIFVSPAVSFLVLRPELFFVRYFLLGTTFGFVALAHPLAAAWRAGGARRGAVAAALALVLAGNGVLTARFYRYGRGAYLDAMRFIAESTTDVAPTVAGDHRFRTGNVIRFYDRYLAPQQRLVIVEQDRTPEWLLLHRIGELGPVDEALTDGRHTYAHVRTYRYSDLSGWHWLLYRLVH